MSGHHRPEPGAPPIVVRHDAFDPLGPPVRRALLPSGRTVRYVDEGRPEWPAMLVFGGAGTSVRAMRLLEFARGFREELGLRLISVERNGLGLTPYDEDCGIEEHAADVWRLLDARGVKEAAVVAISGGGPYAAHVAAARPQRVASVHLVCALSDHLAGAPLTADVDRVVADPVGWWTFPVGSAVHAIPGFADAAAEEATHALAGRGWASGRDGLRQAFALYGEMPLPDLSALDRPAFLYWGADDPVVPTAHLDRWCEALPVRPVVRSYPGEAHDVQYRHWDQVLCDVAHAGRRVVVTERGRTLLLAPDEAARAVRAGALTGMAAWAGWSAAVDESRLDEGDEELAHRGDGEPG